MFLRSSRRSELDAHNTYLSLETMTITRRVDETSTRLDSTVLSRRTPTMTKKTTNSTLAGVAGLLAFTAACGLPTSIALADGSQSAQSQSVSQNDARKLQIASRALNMLPSDQSIMQNALRNPFVFTAVPGNHEFTGQVIVHAKTKRSTLAQSRVAPSIVKSSQFVSEYVVDVPKGLTEGEFAAMLMATGDYEFVEPNYQRSRLHRQRRPSQKSIDWR